MSGQATPADSGTPVRQKPLQQVMAAAVAAAAAAAGLPVAHAQPVAAARDTTQSGTDRTPRGGAHGGQLGGVVGGRLQLQQQRAAGALDASNARAGASDQMPSSAAPLPKAPAAAGGALSHDAAAAGRPGQQEAPRLVVTGQPALAKAQAQAGVGDAAGSGVLGRLLLPHLRR
jgi:hypothetical protein